VTAPDEPGAHGWHRLLIEPPRPDRIRNSKQAPWLVVATVCTGAFMGQLDASIVTLAFPTLRHDFHASLASVQWVGQAYLLILIGLLTAVGSYADMIGRKLLYTYGFVVFVVGSGLCGIAPGLPELVAFRVIQGFGAAMLQANSVAIVMAAVPRHSLGKALGIQGAAQAMGLALGPAVGGLLIGLGGWRLIFYVNVPVGIAGAFLSWLLVPRSRDLAARHAFDWPGLATFLPAIAALLVALSYGDHVGWGSPTIIGLLAATVVLGGVFAWRERTIDAPMLDLGLFRRWAFSAGVGSGLLSFLVLFGTLTVVPFYLEIARGDSTGAAGAQLLVLPLALGVVAPIAGRLADRVGARPLTLAGMVLCGAALALTTVGSTRLLFVAGLIGAGAGLGLFVAPNNAAIMGAAPPDHSGMASGALNMSRGLGTSLGLALGGLAYTIGAGDREVVSTAAAAAGYHVAARALAVVALVAAAIAGFRPAAPTRAADLRYTLE
jgi:EmrB/QacA subfamily drug resistance transporter